MAFLTDSQKSKYIATVGQLFTDPEFSNVASINATFDEVVPTAPVAETDNVTVTPTLPA